jgi:arginyl-tRNA synthetase
LNFSIEELNPKIEYSRNEKFGDYSTAFLLEHKEKIGNPNENSIVLINYLKNQLFSEITFSPPGFINFKISKQELLHYINSYMIGKDTIYPQVAKKEKIIFEFVSANPTGPLNIVSARAAAMGASITNLLEKIGHTVESEFYVNDYGNAFLNQRRRPEFNSKDTAQQILDQGDYFEFFRADTYKEKDEFNYTLQKNKSVLGSLELFWLGNIIALGTLYYFMKL